MEEAADLGNYLPLSFKSPKSRNTQRDVDICLGFDLETMADNAELASIRELRHMLGADFAAAMKKCGCEVKILAAARPGNRVSR